MKIEVLFPEICNLYGDIANVRYLKACMPEAEIIETSLKEEPYFVKNTPDLIYMGTTTEKGQLLAIEALLPYRERINDCIEQGFNFLITGNALEIFCDEIIEEGKKVADGLGILNLTAKRKARKRFNYLYLGDFKAEENIKIVGFKSVFGFAYGDTEKNGLFMTERGVGMNPEIKEEGVRINNFFATYIIGPLLILNPPFTQWFLREVLRQENSSLAFEEAAMDAYEVRVTEYSDPSTGFHY